jgi:hypothetical protein
MCPTLSAVFHWLQTNEALALWVEGIALVAIFGLELAEYKRQGRERRDQHEESATQMRIARDAADAAKASADAVRNSERAWILASIGNLPNVNPTPNSVQVLWIFPTLKNYGKTPARIKRIAGVVKLIPPGQQLPAVPEYPTGQGFDERVDLVLPPEGQMQPRLGFSAQEFIEVQNGSQTLYVHGFVEYLDVHDIERRTAYCFSYVIQSGYSPAESAFYPFLAAPRAYTECT